ncbi:MAG TPA: phosphate ABC transporter permease PstA [Acidimicrobiia bacterium]|nr:phosphate ABC transporter permease PstA [Acidimicrobiia bacterium]
MSAVTSRVPAAALPQRRKVRRTPRELLERPLIIAGSVGVAMALLFAVTPLSGRLGWVLCTYGGFIVLDALDNCQRYGSVVAKDRIATVLIATAGLCTVVPLILIVGYVVSNGLGGITTNFFTETLEAVGPADPATVGGAKHAIIGTLQQVGLATLLSTPLGLFTAVHLAESRGRLARVTRVLVDAMSGIPSIVAGLFIYTMWVVRFDQGFSGLAAAMALSVLMLPTIARTAEEVIKLVPNGLRESSLALGAPEWKTMLRIILPAARSGIVTATVLGISRIAGETAPLLSTAFGTDSVNTNPFTGPQSALPLFAFQRVRNAVPAQIARGWAGALVLIALVLILFTIARAAGGWGASPRQWRREPPKTVARTRKVR